MGSGRTEHPGGGDAPPAGAWPAGRPPEPQPVPELAVSTPTLLRLTIGHPADHVPIGGDDYVLDSTYNPQIDAWEVLVIVQPGGAEDEDG